MDERKCADLIQMASKDRVGREGLRTILIVPPQQYDDDEVRVANAAMERLGHDVKIHRGTLHIDSTSRFSPVDGTFARFTELP